MQELVIKVDGMACSGCENRIQNAVGQIEGVEKVIANHKNGTVIVTLNQDINQDLVKEKIEEIGFEVKE